MKQSDILLSILIPVYNVADYVSACIDSILAQADKHVEIILMNDASTDNSAEVINQYQNHVQVKIFHAEKNAGMSATRNALLKEAMGCYVWFIDSDDAVCKKSYQRIKKAIKKNPDIIIGDFFNWQPHKKSNNQLTYKKGLTAKTNQLIYNRQHRFLKCIIKNNHNYVWNKVLKKSTIEQMAFHTVKFEDIIYMTDLSAVCQTYLYIDKPLIQYRFRVNSTVNSYNESYVRDYLSALTYRVGCCQDDYGFNKKSLAYVMYKSIHRFYGLLGELDKKNTHADQQLITFAMQHFYDVFYGYYQQSLPNMDFIRRAKLKKTIKNIRQWL